MLQCSAVFEQCTHSSAPAGTHHYGHRGSKSQCTGAGNHQNGNSCSQRELQSFTHCHPENKGCQSNAHDHRHKNTGDLICQSCNGRLGAACFFHHADHLMQSGILAHLVCTENKIALCIDGCRSNMAAGLHFHRHTFACEGTLIHAASAFQNRSIHRNTTTGTHHNQIPYAHLICRYGFFLSISQHRRCFRPQIHQCFDSITGLAFCSGFQEFAQRDQGQDHGSRLKIQVLTVKCHCVPVAMSHCISHTEQCRNAVEQCRTGANSNQRIHVGAAMPQCFQTAAEIHPVQIHSRQCQE